MVRKGKKREMPPAWAPEEAAGEVSAEAGPDAEVVNRPATEAEEARIERLEAECERLNDQRLRAEAELANYRRRAQRERDEVEARAKEQVLGAVMALADDLERALDAAEGQERSGPFLDGVRLVHERVREALASHGVEVIDPLGEPFDPHEAEALLELESREFEAGSVAQVIEKGYRQGDRLLRPAKVVVAKAPPRTGNSESRGTE